MILADKIIKLRKQSGWSQEELAERLNVSRQAVSKWESAASIPDMDKIINMSVLFGVSTDYLLKDDKDDIEYSSFDEDNLVRKVGLDEANEYLKLAKNAYHKIAYGVMLCILSPIVLMVSLQYSELNPTSFPENRALVLGFGVLLPIVLVAVMIFINYGMQLSKYEFLEKEVFELDYGVKGVVEKGFDAVSDTFRKNLLMSIAIIFMAAMQLVMGAIIAEEYSMYYVAILLFLVSFAVFNLVRYGSLKESYTKLLQKEEFSTKKKKQRSSTEGFEALYWCVVVAIYLLFSFTTMNWGYTWIIWPIAGVLFGGVMSFLNRDED